MNGMELSFIIMNLCVLGLAATLDARTVNPWMTLVAPICIVFALLSVRRIPMDKRGKIVPALGICLVLQISVAVITFARYVPQ